MKNTVRNEKLRNMGRRWLEWIERRGFYISLILCVGIICVSTLFITSTEIGRFVGFEPQTSQEDGVTGVDLEELPKLGDLSSPKPDASDSSQISPNKKQEDKALAVGAIQKETNVREMEKEAAKRPKPAKYADQKTVADSKIEKKIPKITFARPLSGPVIAEFAKEKLIYSKTLNEWRSHLGIDIKGDKGTPVKVIATGKVKEVKNDPRFGATIVVEHANGWVSMYSNLLKADLLLEGKQFKQGEVIGGVGNTAGFESLDAPHLHFELQYNGQPVNPVEYFPSEKIN